MTDATHDFGAADDGFHEIHLSGKQLVFLFIATTIVSVLIFLLGVMVGRGVPAERQATDQFTDPTPVAASTPAAAPPQVVPPVAEAPLPAADQPATPAPAPAPAATEDLSYKKRLESAASTTESLKPRPTPPASKAAPSPQNSASSAQQAVSGSPQAGVWIVQVHALRDRTVANGIVQRLVNKGYPAFLVAAGPPTGAYKVQVGRFKDREEAQRVVERLKKEEQFNPWITR